MNLIPFLGLHDPVSSLSHLGAAVIAIAAGYFMYRKGRGNVLRTSSLLIFSASLLFVFSMSGVYHALEPGAGACSSGASTTPPSDRHRRLGHARNTLLFKGHWRWSLTALFWGIAITCLVLIDVISRLPYWAIVSATSGWAARHRLLRQDHRSLRLQEASLPPGGIATGRRDHRPPRRPGGPQRHLGPHERSIS